ncbi:hypothetical protein PsP108CL_03635 [Pseudomonas syringae]|nr:hypothetical protein [Pseudomonas syringae]
MKGPSRKKASSDPMPSRSSLYTSLFLILAGGRRSELVRERAGTIAENLCSETRSSRTSSLLRLSGRSVKNPVIRAFQSCI